MLNFGKWKGIPLYLRGLIGFEQISEIPRYKDFVRRTGGGEEDSSLDDTSFPSQDQIELTRYRFI